MVTQGRRTLILIRHAEADWGHTNDFDRPLNAKGLEDAVQMGHHLAQSDILIQKIISSSAKRAKKTTELLAQTLALSLDHIEYQRELYLAPPTTMLDMISAYSDDIQHIAIVAHNPGISELAEILTHRYMDDFPTCSIVVARFQIQHWADIVRGKGEMIYHEYPRRVSGI